MFFHTILLNCTDHAESIVFSSALKYLKDILLKALWVYYILPEKKKHFL